MSEGGKFDYTVQSFTPEQMRRMAENDPSVIVMQNTHDRTYEPLKSNNVTDIVNRLKVLTLELKAQDIVRAKAQEDPVLKDFSSKYKVLFEKMTTLEFVQDDRALNAIAALIDTRAKVERGELSARVAEETAAAVAIRKAIDDDKGRVEEVD